LCLWFLPLRVIYRPPSPIPRRIFSMGPPKQALSVILNISDSLLGLTIFAVGNSLGDLVADITVARLEKRDNFCGDRCDPGYGDKKAK
jgi:hypothetical protein